MSDVNKLDDTQCQINPDQYKIKIDTVTAPVGSCPWAIIQVYLGNKLHRSDWDTPNEYMRLTSKKTGNDSVYIEKSDKHGTWFSWQPTPEDLMACDWILLSEVKPVECMLSFDLEIGTGKYRDDSQQDWGYLSQGGNDMSYVDSTFGTLTNLQNTLGIGNILEFILNEFPIGTFWGIQFQVDTQNQPDLYNRILEVTANGTTYNLGSSPNSTTNFVYNSDGAKQLGDLLKQNLGKTLHFCLNWK
ncbi:Thoeris anti-defense Tad2 family protein [Xenorhabdus bharatensis]|uniref:Thoeris anti-defense Tad2 family protein n=1 Tax=Xenorhabdus bharatensis TaxID=3136256 RepID=UPI0030F3B2CB